MTPKQNNQPESDLPAALAQPAQRALAGAGIQNLKQLTRFTESEVKQLHGIGPNAFDKLKRALEAKVLSFADKKQKKG